MNVFTVEPLWLVINLVLQSEFRRENVYSNLYRLNLIVDLVVERVIIANKHVFDKGLCWGNKA